MVSPYELIDRSRLRLDHKNPRLVEYGISASSTQLDLAKLLWSRMAAQELAASIAHSGYYQHEPLFVEEQGDGTYIVIEGNRRFCAILVLTESTYRKALKAKDAPRISAKSKRALQNLPCVITTRRGAWRYLGFKHVNGPATWGAYAKAEYIARVHNDFDVPLEEIAEQIGDFNHTVERMYHGLMVLEQSENVEKRPFDRTDSYKTKFPFSHLYTALNNPQYRAFLGLKSGSRTKKKPVPKKKEKNLSDLMIWLYGSKSRQIKPLIRSQNPDLKILGEVLANPKAVEAIREELPLELAHDVAMGDERIFGQALAEAKSALQRALGTVVTGFDVEDKHVLSRASELVEFADELLDRMKKKKRSAARTAK